MSPSQPHKSYDHRTRAEKLGVKPGQAVLLVGITDAHFISELQAGGARITRSGSPDVVFCGVDSRAALVKLTDLAKRIKRDGAVWTIRPKGSPLISEADVLKAGKAAGLVDVKVVRFSETHTAEKFVFRLKDRYPPTPNHQLPNANVGRRRFGYSTRRRMKHFK